METIFRKVSTEKRLPDKGGLYWVIDPNGVCGSVKVSAIFQKHTNNWCVVDSGEGDTIHPTYWLEEIEFPSVEILKEKAKQIGENIYNDIAFRRVSEDTIRYTAKWLIDFVFGVPEDEI